MANKSIEKIYRLFNKNPDIVIDSRNVRKGSIFFGLKGEQFDGNSFAGEAIRNGAAMAVVDDPQVACSEECFLVDDTLKTLQNLALYHRKKFNIPFIGITGSNGKTTTKELITRVLEQKYNVIATRGNYNNHIGVPLTLLQVNASHQIAVIEVGANHPGEIGTLCNIALPDYGLITNVGKAHLEGFGTFEGVKKTKKELYDHIKTVGGKILINIEDFDLVMMAREISRITFGFATNKADVVAHQVETNPFLKVVWESVKYKGQYSLETKLLGEYNWTNVMAAITAGILFGLNPAEINNAVASYEPSNNRSQYLKTPENEIILDAYNANPTSMEKAIENFLKLKKENKCLILGEMMELGEQTIAEHETILEIISKNKHNLDQVFLIGKQFSELIPDFAMSFRDTKEAKSYLKKNPLKRKTILVKGSGGNQLEDLTEVL